MQQSRPSIFARDDTLLGVCEALAEDFGCNPLWLRILFALGLLWSPFASLALYAGCGGVVAFARWLVPEPRAAGAGATAAANEAGDEQALVWDDVPIAA